MNSQATTSKTTCETNSSVKMRSANSLADFLALPAVDMRIGRHEGGVERALGKDRAKMIGQAQRHEEGVGHGTGAEDRREHDVAREPGQPRKQGIAADREDASEHAPLLSSMVSKTRLFLPCAKAMRGPERAIQHLAVVWYARARHRR